ncbi:glycosyltransferase family 39 protein [Bacillus sp. AGMB 02131]|uniref:Glycosyltransferase family 39 protein n=1 Tax=Peribacillus faecalis TaxID=2772559 RepID=A0A927CYT9_9BACI|nr:glycosyltransferase family 39 protein [Peribacillus faecalis]MBD3108430.1 glycosyltransferase family 39 protein [Peribacillus faecalis]
MFNNFLSKSLIFLGLIISFFAFIMSTETLYYNNSNNYIVTIFQMIIAGLLLLGITKLCSKSIKQIWFLAILLLVAFAIRLIWVLNVDTPITSDFLVMYNAAMDITNRVYDFSSSPYFTTWTYQLGFTFYQAVILFVFNHSVFALKIFNILFSLGIIVCIYFTGKQLFNETVGRIGAILYALYIPNILYTSVLTNQHIATFIFYLSFYLLIKNSRTSRIAWLYIGIMLALANLMRPLAPVVIIAIIIYFVLYILTKNQISVKEKSLCAAKNIIGILATFILVGKLISAAFIAGGLTDYPLENRDPYWKFVLGFNHETNGGYSVSDAELIMSLPLGEERDEISKQIIMERLEDKSQLSRLFVNKFGAMWGGNDASIYWSLGEVDSNTIFNIDRHELMNLLNKTDQVVYVLIIFFSLIGFVFLLIEKQKEYPYSLYILLIVGYILVHLLIEIQTRYRYFIIPAFILFAGYGLVKTIDLFSKRNSKYIH